MPRPRPPHLQREVTRHGKAVWIVRIGEGPHAHPRRVYGSPEFMRGVSARPSAGRHVRRRQVRPRGACIGSSAISRVGRMDGTSMATRRQRENIFKNVIDDGRARGGDQHRRASTSRPGLIAGANTIAGAKLPRCNARAVSSGPREAQHVKADPTAGVKAPPAPQRTASFRGPRNTCARYQARWPLGTRQRVWLDVLLYTGCAEVMPCATDAARPQRCRARSRPRRAATRLTAVIPILPVLDRNLEGRAVRRPDVHRRRERQAADQGVVRQPVPSGVQARQAFRDRHTACARSRRPRRRTTARRSRSSRRCSAGPMTRCRALYTKTADRERLAIDAGHMLANEERTSMPAPSEQVRAGRAEKQS